jgi:hypothetical protein
MAPTVVKLDLVLLRSRKNNSKIAAHILQLFEERDLVSICKALLEAVEIEALESQVFAILLSATKSIDCIVLCLWQPHSFFIRRQALKQYGKAIGDVDRWEEAWKVWV